MLKMNKILACALTPFLLGCDPDIERKRNEYNQVSSQVEATRQSLSQEQQRLNEVLHNEAVSRENARLLGRDPAELLKQYTVTFRVAQSSLSLSLTEHLKNDMNATEFTVPVSKDYYDAVNVGDHIRDDFRMGSFVLRGKVGSMTVRVKSKETH